METKLVCLSLAAFVFASCDKSTTKAKPDDTSSNKPRVENRAHAPTIAEKTAPARRDSPAAETQNTIDPPLSHPVTAEMIRPAGSGPDDGSWQTLTAEQRVGKFNSSGIARISKNVSDKILSDATSAGNPEDQLNFITQQAAAWHHITKFQKDATGIPEHMRMALVERLFEKHGDSWKDMVPELNEQVDASARVSELRWKGIPGMSPEESQDLILNLLERHGPDYKTILSIAEQNSKK